MVDIFIYTTILFFVIFYYIRFVTWQLKIMREIPFLSQVSFNNRTEFKTNSERVELKHRTICDLIKSSSGGMSVEDVIFNLKPNMMKSSSEQSEYRQYYKAIDRIVLKLKNNKLLITRSGTKIYLPSETLHQLYDSLNPKFTRFLMYVFSLDEIVTAILDKIHSKNRLPSDV
jgi:hypothetical protein